FGALDAPPHRHHLRRTPPGAGGPPRLAGGPVRLSHAPPRPPPPRPRPAPRLPRRVLRPTRNPPSTAMEKPIVIHGEHGVDIIAPEHVARVHVYRIRTTQ